MGLAAAALPAPYGGAGGGQASAGDAQCLTGVVGPGAVIVGDAHGPAAGGRVARGRDVTAEVDEHPPGTRVRRAPGGPVGGERLRGRSQVEPHAGRNAHGPGLAIEGDDAPAGDVRGPDPA